MNHMPMSQGMSDGHWNDEEESFSFPALKKMPKQISWKCRHCGTTNTNTEAVVYHWPDRQYGEKKGYVSCCTSCGCRTQIPSLLLLTQGNQQIQPPRQNQPNIVIRILLGAVAAVGILLVLVMFGNFSLFSSPSHPNSNGTVSSVSSSASESDSLPVVDPEEPVEPAEVVEPEELMEPEEEPENDTVRMLSSMRLGPVSQNDLTGLPESIYSGDWNSKRKVQGVEWNTDTMDTVYFSIASYIVATDPNGVVKCAKETDGYFFSIDYYNGHLFCVWRSGNYGRFKLKVLDPETLKEENSVTLSDMHKKFERDEKDYGGKLCASIDAVTVAPRIGSQDELMVYISYNSYVSTEDGIALNSQQTIYEYNYEEALDPTLNKLTAKRLLSMDLGKVKYGIQTLELDRSTGNIWCAIRQGYSDYSLYLIDSKSKGSRLNLIPNGSQSGWDCPAAGDGLCSLGHDQFYLLIPYYDDGWVSVEIQKVSLDQLEGF